MIPRRLTRLLALAVLASATQLGTPSAAEASPPPLVPLQGYLADRATGPVDGVLSMTFTLYSDAEGTTSVWTETRDVTVAAGVFSLYLGEVSTLALETFRDNHDLWLGMAVDGDTETNLVRVGTTPFAAFAEFAGFANEAETLAGLTADDFAAATHGHAWEEITGVPADLADGDNDTTYEAGAGLALVGTVFGVDFAAVQARIAGSCAPDTFVTGVAEDGTVTCAAAPSIAIGVEEVVAGPGLTGGGASPVVAVEVDFAATQARVFGTCDEGSSIVAIAADGSVVCATPVDENTEYDAGAGLALTGTTFSVDTATVQARVAGACDPGSSIRAVNVDGSVECEADDDTNTEYEAGAGLALVDTTFVVDTETVQARVGGVCPPGSSIQAIAEDGSVTCHVDVDTDTTYSAGAGLSLAGTTFAVDSGAVQLRVGGVCPDGSSIQAIAEDGSVTCHADVDTDTDTTYSAGAGLSLTGTTFAVDSAAVQSRVAGACPDGSSIQAIAEDGSVTCHADVDTDTDTTYSAGAGLTLIGTTFEVDGGVFQRRVGSACPTGSSIQGIAADGTVTCHVDVDTNTTYGAGTGLTLTGTTFSVDTSSIQQRVGGSCPAGSSVRAIAADGTVTCETDDDTTYGAGAGLRLTGSTFSADTSVVQARVAASCPAGQSIRAISASGGVVCEVDDDTIVTYVAGTGLSLTGTTFAVDGTVQRRVTGTCPTGSSVQTIAADGSVTCHVDRDTDTTYSAGTGLALAGTTFAVDASIQRRVSSSCPDGSSIQAIAADGTVTCHVDIDTDTDTNTTYAAGTGLALAGTTFSVDASIQRRVSSSCPDGSSIQAIAADGSVTCHVDVDTDTNTTYAAGTGLSLTGTTFAVDTAAVQRRVASSCPTGSSIQAIAADGSVTCHVDVDTDTDTDTTYDAGFGLGLDGTTFFLDVNAAQARVSGSCPAGSYIRAIADDGTVTCQADQDTDTNTTYAAGTGLSLAGTTFAVDAAFVQRRVGGTCPAGSSIRAIAADGTVTCQTDTDTNTTYAAGTGLSLTGTTFAVDAAFVQRRVGGACPAGSSIRAIAADGTVTCQTDTDTNTTYAAGTGLSLTGTTFAVDAAFVQRRVGGTCPAGSSIRAIAADGTVTCQTDTDTNTTYAAGTGLSLTGTTFAVDAAFVQRRVGGTCPAGSSIRAIAADGTVTCQTDTDTNTTYAAGTGLSLTGTTFAVDTAAVQRRVSSACPAGSSIQAIAADGSVTCHVDVDTDTDTDTTYDAGFGLGLDGTTFFADTQALQARVSGGCEAGQFLVAIGADGSVVCASEEATNFGFGFSFSGTTVDVDATAVQRRVTGTCSAGSSIRAIAQDGTVTCQADTNTTYGAGTGLSLAGTTFSVDTAAIQRRVSGLCSTGTSIQGINADGTVICAPDMNTTYLAGFGVLFGGSAPQSIEVNTSTIQRRVVGACADGLTIQAINADGGVVCGASGVSYIAGFGITIGGRNADVIAVDSTTVQARVSDACPTGSAIQSISATGLVVCEIDDEGITELAFGLEFDDGGAAQVNDSFIQRRVTGSCPEGSSIASIEQDGTVNCWQDQDTVTVGGFGLRQVFDECQELPCEVGYLTYQVDTATIQQRVIGTCPAGQAIRSIAEDGTVVCQSVGVLSVSGGGPITVSGTTNVTVSINENAIPTNQLAWGIPLSLPFLLQQPETFCGDWWPSGAVVGTVEGRTPMFIGNLTVDRAALQHDYKRARLQVTCFSDTGVVAVYANCDTTVPLAFARCNPNGFGVAVSDEFEPVDGDIQIVAEPGSGSFMTYGNPELLLY